MTGYERVFSELVNKNLSLKHPDVLTPGYFHRKRITNSAAQTRVGNAAGGPGNIPNFCGFWCVCNINRFLNHGFFPYLGFLFLLYLIPPSLPSFEDNEQNQINSMPTKWNLLLVKHSSSSLYRWRQWGTGRLSDLPEGIELAWDCWSCHTWPLSPS